MELTLLERLNQTLRIPQDDNEAPGSRLQFNPYHAKSVPKSEDLVRQATDLRSARVTTVMLRNIPNKYTQNSLMQEINDHGFAETYDFFYLPMDVHNRSNVGYSFINFKHPDDAKRFQLAFSSHRFQRFHSKKIGSVCPAHVQGLDANLRHFENRAVTQARNDGYKPVVFHGRLRIKFEEAVADAVARANGCGELPAAPGGGSQHLLPMHHVSPQQMMSLPLQQQPMMISSQEQANTTLQQTIAAFRPPVAAVPTANIKDDPQSRHGLEDAIVKLLASQQQGSAAADFLPPPGLDALAAAAAAAGQQQQPAYKNSFFEELGVEIGHQRSVTESTAREWHGTESSWTSSPPATPTYGGLMKEGNNQPYDFPTASY
jgi:hypothetical protein